MRSLSWLSQMLMECIGRLKSRSLPKQIENGKGVEVTLTFQSAVVVDDAFGPPALGAIQGDDKSKWIDHITDTPAGEAALRAAFDGESSLDLDALLIKATSDYPSMVQLWRVHKEGQQPEANLALLFGTVELDLQGKASAPQQVVDTLTALCGSGKVQAFADMESAMDALSAADIAFIDFYLRDGEGDDDALARVTKYAETLKQVKLLFIMSSRATLDDQTKVKGIVGRRSAFFDVLRKTDITAEFLDTKIARKRDTYTANRSLEDVINALVGATDSAVREFKSHCEDLEVHDLRLLDLARLHAEGESLPEYLTWLFSETIAAKTRRMALPLALGSKIETEAIGFSGQIHQGRALFDLFAQVVFGPPVVAGSPIRFGELLVEKSSGKHLLVLTPACDLQRCEITKPVLCVTARSTAYTGYKELAEKKLYGKLGGGIRHLYCSTQEEKPKYTMLDWQTDEIVTHTVQILKNSEFERIALMNEIFAQELKEEVLRKLGRVGTQIDPPPPIALNAKLRWKDHSGTVKEEVTPEHSFISALLTYAETKDEGDKSRTLAPAVVLSEEFRHWAIAKIKDSFVGTSVSDRMETCLKSIQTTHRFILKNNFNVTADELRVRAVELAAIGDMEKKCLVEIDLLLPAPSVGDSEK